MRCAKCEAEIPAGQPVALCPVCALGSLLTPSYGSDGQTRIFGEYHLLEELGRGGMGVVWRARQSSLNRFVALKMVAGGELARVAEVRRFRKEAEAAARLQHPNIVRIHEIGEVEGQPYFTMDYVEGIGLDVVIRDRALTPKRAAEYMRKIAEAVHYAHENGIVHRDLKPSNVLIDENDEPRVLDFGLAKHLDVESSLTLTGELIGSPNYMAPEQAAGRHDDVNQASDIYSLGAMLYHMVTGKPPFQSRSIAETLHQVQTLSPTPLRWVDRSIPFDLETICFKCLEKNPKQRYGTARELARDLELFLADRPIRARRVSDVEKSLRWCRRNPIVATLSAALMLTLAIGIVHQLWKAKEDTKIAEEQSERERIGRLEAERLRKLADDAALLANEAARRARANAYAADIVAASVLTESGDHSGARELLKGYAGSDSRDLRGFEWRHLWHRTRPNPSTIGDRTGHVTRSSDIRAFGLHPTRQELLVISTFHIETWNSETLKLVSVKQHGYLTDGHPSMWGAELASNGRTFAASSPRGIALVDLNTAEFGRVIPAFESSLHDERFFNHVTLANGWRDILPLRGNYTPAFWPNMDRLAAPTPTEVQVHWLESNRVEVLKGVSKKVAVSKDGTVVAATGIKDGELHIFSGDTLVSAGVLSIEKLSEAEPLAIASDGSLLAAGMESGSVLVWRLRNSSEAIRLTNHTVGPVRALSFSPDNAWLAASGRDYTVKLVSTADWKRELLLQGHTNPVTHLAFTPDGRRLMTGDQLGEVRSWILPFETRVESVSNTALSASEHGRFLRLLASEESAVSLKAPENSDFPKRSLLGWVGSRDGRWIAEREANELKLWGSESTEPVSVAPFRAGLVSRELFSEEGNAFAIADYDKREVVIFSIPSLTIQSRLPVKGPIVHMEGDVLIDSPTRNTLQARKATDGQFVALMDIPVAIGTVVDISSDGGYIAIANGREAEVRVFSLPEGRLFATLLGGHAGHAAVQFSPDGRTLAIMGLDGTVTLWSMQAQRRVLTLAGPRRPKEMDKRGRWAHLPLLFSRDGTALASFSQDGPPVVWRTGKESE